MNKDEGDRRKQRCLIPSGEVPAAEALAPDDGETRRSHGSDDQQHGKGGPDVLAWPKSCEAQAECS
jgi:hypothetical protein